MNFDWTALEPGTYNLHTHTLYCDGRDTPAEMAEAALEAGLRVLGFSGHSYTPGLPFTGMAPESEAAYRVKVQTLREEYRGRLTILCGLEQDVLSAPAAGYDYLIGSVHFVEKSGERVPVDDSPEQLARDVARLWDGDWYALCEDYYRQEAEVIRRTGGDIIGHFDLVSKFNEGGRFFDEAHSRCRTAWQAAAEALLETGKPFEINTGAIARGWRSEPYPSLEKLTFLKARGAKLLLSSDCHDRRFLTCGFDKYKSLI
jgi:histidinol-phosphatase (PHP family)